MPEPLVSIIMPAYNAGKFIAQSIQSVVDQTCSNWELIVVDDGSTDRTAEAVQAFARGDTRIKYFYQKNRGQGVAKNTGIQAAGGDFIAFLDADDLWCQSKLTTQTGAMLETGADLVFSNGFTFTEDDALHPTGTFDPPTGKLVGQELVNALFLRNIIPILSVLVRREVLRKGQLFPEEGINSRRCEDYDLWFRLAWVGATFFGLNEKLVKYRSHGSSTSANIPKLIEAEINVLQTHLNKVTLGRRVIAKRFRQIYRALLTALLEQKQNSEAYRRAQELYPWDKFWRMSFCYLLVRSRYRFLKERRKTFTG